VNGDTLRWRGVLAEDGPASRGLTVADLRTFLAAADALAATEGIAAGAGVPRVAVHRDGTIHHIWFGVRRHWHPLSRSPR
jgi:hypothetical protein